MTYSSSILGRFGGWDGRPALNRGGFTLIEVLVVVAIVLTLAALMLPKATQTHVKSDRIRCVNRLKQVGLGFRLASGDTSIESGLKGVTNGASYQAWLVGMSNILGNPEVLVCPTDRSQRAEARTWAEFARPDVGLRAVSWFVMPEANETRPQLILFGDRSLEGSAPLPLFSYRAPKSVTGDLGTNAAVLRASLTMTPDAMHRGEGNVVLSDGSVQQMTPSRLVHALAGSGDTRNTLVQPGGSPE